MGASMYPFSSIGRKRRVMSEEHASKTNPIPTPFSTTHGAFDQADLHSGMKVSAGDDETPKDCIFGLFRSNGHIPRERNTRKGYIIVQCTMRSCSAQCNASANIGPGPGWVVTICSEQVNKRCPEAPAVPTPASSFETSKPSCMLCIVVYGGVWWCTCMIVTRL